MKLCAMSEQMPPHYDEYHPDFLKEVLANIFTYDFIVLLESLSTEDDFFKKMDIENAIFSFTVNQ